MADAVCAIAIGRNEGARLVACLDALADQVDRVIYVDSGSTDGSIAAARERGVEVVMLDMSQPFTAARARNAGLAQLTADGAARPETVQFLDGDCVLQGGWVDRARAFLDAHPDVAVVCGRRRERHPEASLYNRMIDREWDTPVGEAKACGGDALMRTQALVQVGGYNPTLIAGEEPELCLRLRRAGWRIWRLDAEMTLHDADITRYNQWWQRARRGGYAYAEGVAMHGRTTERYRVRELIRIVVWALVLPLVILVAAFVTPWALVLVAIWPLQVLRMVLRGTPLTEAAFLTLAKFPEAQGVLTYLLRRLKRSPPQLIEYK